MTSQEPKIRIGDVNPTNTAKLIDFVKAKDCYMVLVGVGKDFAKEEPLSLQDCEALWSLR